MVECMKHRDTLDQVFANNLRLLREGRGWSRRMLTEKLAIASDRPWPVSKIIDLEGGRTGKPPASVQWRDLVTLCLVFGVPLWDLVLPKPGEAVIVAGGKTDEFGLGYGNRFHADAPLLAEILSAMPGRVFTDEEYMASAKALLTDKNLDWAFIEAKQLELDELRSRYETKIQPETNMESEPTEKEHEQGGEHV
jgi:hypothetical protein